ncbi:hypothetical protein B0H14DRAFT_2630849 [Mycena olivaceomarginata]|nr:hypothetical protein B0H14DRAFT_2630849 [Mycena olivaceomarginata]
MQLEDVESQLLQQIVVRLSLIPAFGTLYQRLMLAESTRFIASQEKDESSLKKQQAVEANSPAETNNKESIGKLLGFYGINLNQNVVLQQIEFDGKTGTAWEKLFKVSTGNINIIITALGFVPGKGTDELRDLRYYASVLLIEVLGRKWIQIQGFIMAGIFCCGDLGSKIPHADFLQLWGQYVRSNSIFLPSVFNVLFGFTSSTTYCYPAEVFPTRFPAHGLFAIAGKAGAIISALAFNSLSNKIGTDKVLWIFVGCCFAGAIFTFLLHEVRRRDPDMVLAEEIEAARLARRAV